VNRFVQPPQLTITLHGNAWRRCLKTKDIAKVSTGAVNPISSAQDYDPARAVGVEFGESRSELDDQFVIQRILLARIVDPDDADTLFQSFDFNTTAQHFPPSFWPQLKRPME
jgi:hypothetical protein